MSNHPIIKGSESVSDKKQGNKPIFRSSAKRAAYEYLEQQLRNAQRKLKENKYQLLVLQKEQGNLKRDIAGLHQVIQEFKK